MNTDELNARHSRLMREAPVMLAELKEIMKGYIDYQKIKKIVDRVEGEV